MTPPNTAVKFWSKLRPNAETGCWEWTASTAQGYGQVSFVALTGNNHPVRAHRIAWALAKNDGRLPPKGTHVHHVCANRLCANPDHLVLVTPRQHSREHHGDKCPKGHGAQHWRIRKVKSGQARYCRECDRIRNAENRAKRAVPCIACGRPRSGPKDTNRPDRGTVDSGMCVSCFVESLRKAS